MSLDTITDDVRYLAAAAIDYFNDIYERPKIKIYPEVDPSLPWRPSLHFKAPGRITIAVEASLDPYSVIIKMKFAEILHATVPISIYVICPEYVFNASSYQKDIKDMQKHGLGLLTVDENSIVTRRLNCIPLVQHIPETEFISDITGLPIKLRRRYREAFDDYNTRALSGLQECRQIIEDLINGTVKQAIRKNWLTSNLLNESAAIKIDKLLSLSQFANHMANLGGVRYFLRNYGNIASHPAKSKKQAFERIKKCRDGFKNSIEVSKNFIESLKSVGLEVKLGSD